MTTNRQDLVKKWQPILEHDSLPAIKDAHRREVTAILLENQEREMAKQQEALFETAPTNSVGSYSDTGGIAKFDPVLISLVRRAMPQMIAYDIAGVQPMTQPTGLIFAMKSRYTSQSTTPEALFNEADAGFSGDGTANGGSNPVSGTYDIGRGITTAAAERLGQGGSGDGAFAEMSFVERGFQETIPQSSVTLQCRLDKMPV